MAGPATAYTSVQRRLSPGIMRGLTMTFIIVNNNGSDEAWARMHHAQWNGFTATDLVFPTFLFVVGASNVFAFEARPARGAGSRQESTNLQSTAPVLIHADKLIRLWLPMLVR